MSVLRRVWTYINHLDVEVTEPVGVQGKEWASAAVPTQIVDPNSRIGVQPRTNGWYNEIPDGAEHNFQFRRLSLLLSEIERRGICPWSNLTDYTVPAIVFASDGSLYEALAPSGPGEGGAQDPVDDLLQLYWTRITLPTGNVGQVIAMATDTPPPGTLECDGSALLSSNYQALYNVIGNNYGGGTPPFSNFNLPDYRGSFLRGFGNIDNRDAGASISYSCNFSNGSSILTLNPSVLPGDYFEVGMVVQSISVGGVSVPTNTTIQNIIDSGTGHTTYPIKCNQVILSNPVTTTGPTTAVFTFTNRRDRGDGEFGVGTIGSQQYGSAGRHSHDMLGKNGSSIVTGTVVTEYWDLLNRVNRVAASPPAIADMRILADGTYSYHGRDTRPYNISVLYCIRYK